MPGIHMESRTSLDPDEILKRIEAELGGNPRIRSLVDSYQIEGRKVAFSSNQGVNGTVEVAPGKITVDLKLSARVWMIRGFIEKKLRELLDRFAEA